MSAVPWHVLATVDRGLTGRRRGVGSGRSAQQEARVAAHLLVRWCAARVTGRPLGALEVVHRCTECGSTDHGKPSLVGFPDLHISLAHRPGAVVAAAGWTPVGVDVEVPDVRSGAPALLPDVLTPGEIAEVGAATDPSAAFLRLWVRKECLVELGVTTLDSLRDVDLAGAGAGAGPSAGGTATRHGRLHLLDWWTGTRGRGGRGRP